MSEPLTPKRLNEIRAMILASLVARCNGEHLHELAELTSFCDQQLERNAQRLIDAIMAPVDDNPDFDAACAENDALRTTLAEWQAIAGELGEALRKVSQMLTIPAAEYVPAIGDTYPILDTALAKYDAACSKGRAGKQTN